jgi:leucyl aminopeptidase
MELKARSFNPVTVKTDCLALLVPSRSDLGEAGKAVDEATGGLLTRVLKAGELKKSGDTVSAYAPAGLAAGKLLLVSAGDKTPDNREFVKLAGKVATGLGTSKSGALCLDDAVASDRDTAWCAEQIARALGEAAYRYDQTKSSKEDAAALRKLQLQSGGGRESAKLNAALTRGVAIAEGVNYARELGDLPANICTPGYLARRARSLATKHKKITTRVLNEKQMRELKMGSLLSVTAGTDCPAHMIVMEYKGAPRKTDKPVALVGKGVTFDSGGISLKPGAGMDEMKYDMCGAASVFGSLVAAAKMELPVNIVAAVPAVENMPSGRATKPGDVVTSMSGQTIEVLNTDAEGRLILCDALTYVGRYKPRAVIDIATLTGACVVALGNHASGLFSNDDNLADALLASGEAAGDRAWRLPIWSEYDRQLKSNFADMANIGGKGAGSITAACFLARFTREYQWAHLDVAGTAWNTGAQKGATGRPVPLLIEYLSRQAGG